VGAHAVNALLDTGAACCVNAALVDLLGVVATLVECVAPSGLQVRETLVVVPDASVGAALRGWRCRLPLALIDTAPRVIMMWCRLPEGRVFAPLGFGCGSVCVHGGAYTLMRLGDGPAQIGGEAR